MTARAGFEDTEPLGALADNEDTLPGEAEEAHDTIPSVHEDDADVLLCWHPMRWLAQRRRRELIERPFSDGGDFVAYASAARPLARATSRTTLEPLVRVQPSALMGAGLLGGEARSRAPATADRDAPTVIKPRRRISARLANALWAALAVVAVVGWLASAKRVGREDAEGVLPAASHVGLSIGSEEATIFVPSLRVEAHVAETRLAPEVGAATASLEARPTPLAGKAVRASVVRFVANAGETRVGPTLAKDQYFEMP